MAEITKENFSITTGSIIYNPGLPVIAGEDLEAGDMCLIDGNAQALKSNWWYRNYSNSNK